MRRTTWILTALVSTALLVAGCGDDGGGGGGALTLTADAGGAISWEPADLSASAGSVTVKLVNESDVPHAVEVEGNGVNAETDTLTGGKADVTVDLEAGEYKFICPVDGHAAAGMEGSLTVR